MPSSNQARHPQLNPQWFSPSASPCQFTGPMPPGLGPLEVALEAGLLHPVAESPAVSALSLKPGFGVENGGQLARPASSERGPNRAARGSTRSCSPARSPSLSPPFGWREESR